MIGSSSRTSLMGRNSVEISGDYESEEETRLLAESFGAVTVLDKAKLYDQLIPAILQTGN